MPRWWLCLGITDLDTALKIEGFKTGLVSKTLPIVRRFSHATEAGRPCPLMVPKFESVEEFRQWQSRQRQRFVDRMLYRYDGQIAVTAGPDSDHETHRRREFHVTVDGQRLFRFFRLEPRDANATSPLPTVVCFMGHGKVAQILDDGDSYQHACAARFAEAGYLVFAMENIGMEPGRDTHHDLDQSLRLEGHGWYSLLFAHQRILLDHVFADSMVDRKRVGATGVSTGGLLALSAAVIEPRIAATSVQGIFGSMRVSFIRDRHRHCKCGAIPGLLPEFDLPELALLVTPRPLHISNGRTDGFSPQEAQRCVERISPLHQQAGGSEILRTVSLGGHEYSLPPALKFFRQHLATGPQPRPADSEEPPFDVKGTWIETPWGQPVVDRGAPGDWDHLAVDNPYVHVEDGTYFCFYEAQDKPIGDGGHEAFGIAVSREGLRWRKLSTNPILRPGNAGDWDDVVAKLPAGVIKRDGIYYLFYSGRDSKTKQIGLATARNLAGPWTKSPDNPVLKSRPDNWDRHLSTYPSPIIEIDGQYHLLFRGMHTRYTRQGVGLAVSTNLADWKRQTDVPVIPVAEEIASLSVFHSNDRTVGISQPTDLANRRYWFSTDLRTWTKGPAVNFRASVAAETISNPFVANGRWTVLYEQQDRIYRAVLHPTDSTKQ